MDAVYNRQQTETVNKQMEMVHTIKPEDNLLKKKTYSQKKSIEQ
jgi:hypothetical protein